MRRILLSVTICAVAVSTGCTARGTEEGKVLLTYTRWGEPAAIEASRELIAEFERQNPDVKVRVDAVIWEQYWQKIKASAAAKTVQDVWMMSNAYVEEYASAGYLLDLMPLIKADPTFKAEDYFPHRFDLYSFAGEGKHMRAVPFGEGQLYGLTFTTGCRLLYYNCDHFDALRLAYPTADWTWDDLIRAAKALTRDFDGDGIIDQWGYGGLEVLPFVAAIGGRTLDPDRRKSTYSSARVIKSIVFLRDLIHKHKVHPPPYLPKGETGEFVTGKISMIAEGSWKIRLYNDAEFVWDIAPVPVDVKGRKNQTAGGGSALSISSSTRHPKEAWRLVRFMTSDAAQRKMARSGTAFPVLKSAAYSKDFLAPFKYPPPESYHVIYDTLKTPSPAGQYSKGYLEYSRYAMNTLDAVWRNNRTPEEACRMIDERTNKILAEHYGEDSP